MKTKELIAALQEHDPKGEEEVCIGNKSVWFVSREPGYYDGCLQKLIRNPNKKGYNIEGVEIISKLDKIRLHSIDIKSIFLDHPEAIIKYDSEYSEKHYKAYVEKIRQEAIDFNKEIERE